MTFIPLKLNKQGQPIQANDNAQAYKLRKTTTVAAPCADCPECPEIICIPVIRKLRQYLVQESFIIRSDVGIVTGNDTDLISWGSAPIMPGSSGTLQYTYIIQLEADTCYDECLEADPNLCSEMSWTLSPAAVGSWTSTGHLYGFIANIINPVDGDSITVVPTLTIGLTSYSFPAMGVLFSSE